MFDVHTGNLLATVEDALCPPPHLTPAQLGDWYSHTLRNRLPLIGDALRIAYQEGDAEPATQLIDQAIADHPAPRPYPRRRSRLRRRGARPMTSCLSPSGFCVPCSISTGT